MMSDLTELVAQLRGEVAPAERWDPKASGQSLIGNPKRRREGRRS